MDRPYACFIKMCLQEAQFRNFLMEINRVELKENFHFAYDVNRMWNRIL